jgi:hypothetical protein
MECVLRLGLSFLRHDCIDDTIRFGLIPMRLIHARRQNGKFEQVFLATGEGQSFDVVEFMWVLSTADISMIQLTCHDIVIRTHPAVWGLGFMR